MIEPAACAERVPHCHQEPIPRHLSAEDAKEAACAVSSEPARTTHAIALKRLENELRADLKLTRGAAIAYGEAGCGDLAEC